MRSFQRSKRSSNPRKSPSPVVRAAVIGVALFSFIYVYTRIQEGIYTNPGGHGYAISEPVCAQGLDSIVSSSQDRILVIAPHSDDETLGAGGFLYDAVRCKAKAYVVLMTNGDGFTLAADREFRTLRATSRRFIELGYIRQRESLEALKILGVPKENVFFLGYPDKGLARMWHEHWAAFSPYLSRFTKTYESPYFNSYRPDTLYSGEDVIKDLEDIILKVRPTIILTAAPVDMHPDHWATYNFTLYAIEDIDQKGTLLAPKPQVLWYLVHRGEWPYPKGFRPNAELLPPKGLVGVGFRWLSYRLSDGAVLAKTEAIRIYRSQISIMARYLLSFARTNELFVEAGASFVPDIPWPGLIIDGRVDDWPLGMRPMEEPVKDCMVRKIEGGGDFASVLAGKDRTNLYLAINLRTEASREILYRIHLHSVGVRGHEGPEGDIDFTFRPRQRGPVYIAAPAHRGTKLEGIKAASQDKTIEIAIPLELLGNPRSLFLGVESRFQGIMIDRTTWRVLRIY